MDDFISKEDKNRIESGIRSKYVNVADNPKGLFRYPVGRDGLEGLNYDSELIESLPDAVADSYCGVGNPFSLGSIDEGDSVLDIGCGAGVDTIIAAMMTGSKGLSVGIDMVPEMLSKARSNLELTEMKNVSFQQASGESLPFEDDSFDVVISNGVVNLIPDKASAMVEVFRVLRPGGRLMIADQLMIGDSQKDLKERVESWFQ
ncbi:methyltransferase domain-containing protein [Dethiosulfovibrio acidaminovorans]|uniref:Methyltransferase domain-containing protein n=2 Tax=Dethiosulfovibrio TaxID=47054 RepID=A0ABS9EM70_9BACT|nr:MULTISPECIES: methyltransferase domain-containing protein [Dethiosulfovibrio]MCF4113233.1 methyltransferase domain-containing protein [Dethiosulfovibrio russensis]MCF4142297.1 methyltransferase domain-containing protein [Dethiosulfovibrio marinus]MCF4144605.1 methyltransferase domain-containing protein [Dethiosulfovibrio acidaminovorans]